MRKKKRWYRANQSKNKLIKPKHPHKYGDATGLCLFERLKLKNN